MNGTYRLIRGWKWSRVERVALLALRHRFSLTLLLVMKRRSCACVLHV